MTHRLLDGGLVQRQHLAAMVDNVQPVQPPPAPMVHAAGLWVRAAAFTLDSLLVGLVSLAVCSSLGLVDWLAWPDVQWNLLDLIVDIVNAELGSLRHLALAAAVVGLCYGTVTEATLGATPGKRLLGLRVIDRYGRRPWLLLLVIRNVVKLASTAVLGLGPLWCFVDSERRAAHDLASGTRVVRARAVPAGQPGGHSTEAPGRR